MGEEPLVEGERAFSLGVEPNKENSSHYDIVWNSGTTGNTSTVITQQLRGGSLQSALQLRDDLINKYVEELDELATTLIKETNKLHVSGQGLERFSSLTSSNSVENPAYLLDRTPGLFPFEVKNGTFQIKLYDSDGVLVETYDVSVDPSKDTLNGVVEKIASADNNFSGGNIHAGVNAENKLTITVSDGYTFAFGDDTSDFLIAAGFNNFFQGTDAASIDVDAHIKDNPQYIAASKTGAPGDNQNAEAMNKLQFTKVVEGKITISDFYGFFTGQLAIDKQQVDIFTNTKQLVVDQYTAQMLEIRGVNMDEEVINLALFQRILEANSRFVNAVDAMLDTIVNNLGLVGR
jgi:flagellar hook-associated protein 1 FlgK